MTEYHRPYWLVSLIYNIKSQFNGSDKTCKLKWHIFRREYQARALYNFKSPNIYCWYL